MPIFPTAPASASCFSIREVSSLWGDALTRWWRAGSCHREESTRERRPRKPLSVNLKKKSGPATPNFYANTKIGCPMIFRRASWVLRCVDAIAGKGRNGWRCDFWAATRTSTSVPRSRNSAIGGGSTSTRCRDSSFPSNAIRIPKSSRRFAISPNRNRKQRRR
jgi:hypothetical protein